MPHSRDSFVARVGDHPPQARIRHSGGQSRRAGPSPMTTTVRSSHSLRSDITFAFALALAGYVAWLLRHVLVLLYVSALFSIVLQPLVQSIADIRIGRFQPFRRVAIFILLLFVV